MFCKFLQSINFCDFCDILLFFATFCNMLPSINLCKFCYIKNQNSLHHIMAIGNLGYNNFTVSKCKANMGALAFFTRYLSIRPQKVSRVAPEGGEPDNLQCSRPL